MNCNVKSSLKAVWQWLSIILIAMAIAYVVNVFVFERAKVDGSSMLPTLMPSESLFEFKTAYFFTEPKRGDIVVFEHKEGIFKSKFMPLDPQQENYVKRIVGLPGETIDIVNGRVYINEKLLVEPYLIEGTETTLDQQFDLANPPEVQMTFPYTIPEGEYFVMGDNRVFSIDSRSVGSVSRDKIRGKVLFVMFPFTDIRVPNSQPAYLYEE